jgi:predicted amidohydrolase
MCNVEAFLDGKLLFDKKNLNILPETGVHVQSENACIHRIIHKGKAEKAQAHFHLAAWQMLNQQSLEENTASIMRGIKAAAANGVQLLVSPETSLTGLYPLSTVTRNKKAIAAAEKKVARCLRQTKNAPYLIIGLPVWKKTPGQGRTVRYNACRLYSPDGKIVSTHAKAHSCERDFWHGHRIHEFEICGIPMCMHICHDGRYPELWTLPVMFGARVIIHPSNSGKIRDSIEAFEARAKQSVTPTSHAFYLHVNGGGGSFICSPHKYDNLLAVSEECKRSATSFPMPGEPQECLVSAVINTDEAFGYWPIRSFRASEKAASAYYELYKAMGGKRRLE